MTETFLAIRKWGNSLGVRLPLAIAREAKLHADQRVRISVENGRIIITPLSEGHLTLEQRLASFDPARHGGEDMLTAENRGAEK
jgi:antitoxin MazE